MHGERKGKVLGADACWAGLDGWGVWVSHRSSGLVHPKYLSVTILQWVLK